MSKARSRKDHEPEYKLSLIESRTTKVGECLIWKGNVFKRPKKDEHKPIYPYMCFKNKVWRGNRLVLFLTTGKNPKNLNALHKCDNSLCVNKNHLYWGTQKQNVKDSYDRKRSRNSKVTHCPVGHEYSGDNLRIHKGTRFCKSCHWYKSRKMKPQIEQIKFDSIPQKARRTQ